MSVTTENFYTTTGIQLPPDACVVIVRTEWNAEIVDELQKGCIQSLDAHQVSWIVVTVPGAFEIPFAIKTYWNTYTNKEKSPHAFIALGCVLKGDTPHFDYVCKAITDSVVQLNLTLPVPTIFGVLTVNNHQQASERIGGKQGNKGEESAITAIKMIALSYSLTKTNS
jgi:6,7-dimethyl-8-ribityllumazine synthase